MVEEGLPWSEDGEALAGPAGEGICRGCRLSSGVELGAYEHLGTQACVGFVKADLGLEGISLQLGFAHDTGYFSREPGIRKEVGGQHDWLANLQGGRLGQGNVDPGLQFPRVVEFDNDGTFWVIALKHPLFPWFRVKMKNDPINGSPDDCSFKRKLHTGKFGLGRADSGIHGEFLEVDLVDLCNHTGELGCCFGDDRLLSIHLELCLPDLPGGD